MTSNTASAQAAVETTVTRFVGFCAICEQDHRLDPQSQRLVHHGYKRPGDGFIHGDCMAVGELAYEVSSEVLVRYRAVLLGQLKAVELRLGRFERGEVHFFTQSAWRRHGGMEEYSYSLFVTPYDVYILECDYIARKLRGEAASLKAEIERASKWIDGWSPKPVRTLEEKVEEERRAAAERKAARDAVRAERDAKKAATAAKQQALEERREAQEAELKGVIVVLAARARAGEIVKAEAAKVARALKKASWIWPHSLNLDEDLIAIGLAKRTTPNRVDYRIW